MLLAGQQTCDSQVTGLSPGWAPFHSGLGQATGTCMPLSASSIICYRPNCVQNLGIFIDSDVSMKTHISKTVSSCFAALRRLRSIRRSVSQALLLSLVTSLIMMPLDYGNAVLAGLPSHLLNRLQSVLNAAARLVCCARKYDHVTHLLRDLRCGFRKQYSLLAFCCRNHKAPSYLADELHWTDEAESRHRLRSGSCPHLIVPRTRFCTIGDRSFHVTVARAWNSLPTSITALTSLPSFKRQL